MKRYFSIVALLMLFASCDKVEQPFETQPASEVDTNLYSGNWVDYPWPVFTPNTNTNRNLLLEDYTGHQCVFCPAAADLAKQLEEDHAGRLFVASIHAGPGGVTEFQETDNDKFSYDFTNPEGLAYGQTFASGFGFTGNPRGTVSRAKLGGEVFKKASDWTQTVTDLLTANTLEANVQAKVNYFSDTRGLYLHTEVDPMAIDPSMLNLVVYFVEDTFVSPQKRQTGAVTETIMDYVHHNVHRGNLDGLAFGRSLSETYKRADGLYQVNMSYRIPDQYDPSNCHLLVYVMNKETYEIYQVVKVDIP